MCKKLFLLLGMLVGLPALNLSAASSDGEEMEVFSDSSSHASDDDSDSLEIIDFKDAKLESEDSESDSASKRNGETPAWRRTDPRFDIELDADELNYQKTGSWEKSFSENVYAMGKSCYKAARNVAAPAYSKKYKDYPKLGHAHGVTHWLGTISALTGFYALKKAYNKAHAEIVAELKEAKKTASDFELRKAAGARMWSIIKKTKIADQKLLVGSGFGLICAIAAKLLVSYKPDIVGEDGRDYADAHDSDIQGDTGIYAADPTTKEYFESGPFKPETKKKWSFF